MLHMSKHYALQIQHFILKIMSIGSQTKSWVLACSLSSSSAVQYTINNSPTYVYEHFESFLFHLQL